MSLFSRPLHLLTFEDVRKFCEQKVAENVRVEYKQDFSSKGDVKVAKEVAAFANAQGGALIMGVEEDEQRRPKLPLIGVDAIPDPTERIKATCLDAIYPPIVPEVQAYPIEGSTNRVVVVVRVSESDETPHSIDGRKGIYIRANDIAVPREATVEEIEWLLNRRQKTVEHRERLLERARLRRSTIPNFRNDCFLATMSVVPLYPRESLFRLSSMMPIVQDFRHKPSLFLERHMDTVQTAHEGWISYYSPGVGKTDPYQFIFSQFDQFGLLYYSESVGETVEDFFKKQSHESVREVPFLIDLYRMLLLAGEIYQKGNYWGLLQIKVEFENALRKGLAGTRNYDIVTIHGLSPDSTIPIERVVQVSHVVDAVDEVALDMYKELRWAFGAGAEALDHGAAEVDLEFAKMSVFGEVICPQCGRGRMAKTRKRCLDCERASASQETAVTA